MKFEDFMKTIKTEDDVKSEFLKRVEGFYEEMATYTSDESENTIIVLATNGKDAIISASGKALSMAALIDGLENKNPSIRTIRSLKALGDILSKIGGGNSDSK